MQQEVSVLVLFLLSHQQVCEDIKYCLFTLVIDMLKKYSVDSNVGGKHILH